MREWLERRPCMVGGTWMNFSRGYTGSRIRQCEGHPCVGIVFSCENVSFDFNSCDVVEIMWVSIMKGQFVFVEGVSFDYAFKFLRTMSLFCSSLFLALSRKGHSDQVFGPDVGSWNC